MSCFAENLLMVIEAITNITEYYMYIVCEYEKKNLFMIYFATPFCIYKYVVNCSKIPYLQLLAM